MKQISGSHCISSIYMVNILFRHRKTAQHVRSTIQSSQGAPEIKATKLILMLAAAVPAPFWDFVLHPAEVPSVPEPRSQQPHEDRAR
ncbi:hypothetical protein R6Z07F_001944 [Ovis aries]